jgi:DNA-binding MarR family transcriptional regulator
MIVQYVIRLAGTNAHMKLFAALKKIRELEKAQLPFLKSIIDFDLLVEIGYAEEQDHPLTLKQVVLLDIASRTTVRRRLLRLIEQGAVRRRRDVNDRRSSLLTISTSHRKVFVKYGGALTAICGAMG